MPFILKVSFFFTTTHVPTILSNNNNERMNINNFHLDGVYCFEVELLQTTHCLIMSHVQCKPLAINRK